MRKKAHLSKKKLSTFNFSFKSNVYLFQKYGVFAHLSYNCIFCRYFSGFYFFGGILCPFLQEGGLHARGGSSFHGLRGGENILEKLGAEPT